MKYRAIFNNSDNDEHVESIFSGEISNGLISLTDENGWIMGGIVNLYYGFGANCTHPSGLYPLKHLSGLKKDGRYVGHWGYDGVPREGTFSLTPIEPKTEQ